MPRGSHNEGPYHEDEEIVQDESIENPEQEGAGEAGKIEMIEMLANLNAEDFPYFFEGDRNLILEVAETADAKAKNKESSRILSNMRKAFNRINSVEDAKTLARILANHTDITSKVSSSLNRAVQSLVLETIEKTRNQGGNEQNSGEEGETQEENPQDESAEEEREQTPPPETRADRRKKNRDKKKGAQQNAEAGSENESLELYKIENFNELKDILLNTVEGAAAEEITYNGQHVIAKTREIFQKEWNDGTSNQTAIDGLRGVMQEFKNNLETLLNRLPPKKKENRGKRNLVKDVLTEIEIFLRDLNGVSQQEEIQKITNLDEAGLFLKKLPELTIRDNQMGAEILEDITAALKFETIPAIESSDAQKIEDIMKGIGKWEAWLDHTFGFKLRHIGEKISNRNSPENNAKIIFLVELFQELNSAKDALRLELQNIKSKKRDSDNTRRRRENRQNNPPASRNEGGQSNRDSEPEDESNDDGTEDENGDTEEVREGGETEEPEESPEESFELLSGDELLEKINHWAELKKKKDRDAMVSKYKKEFADGAREAIRKNRVRAAKNALVEVKAVIKALEDAHPLQDHEYAGVNTRDVAGRAKAEILDELYLILNHVRDDLTRYLDSKNARQDTSPAQGTRRVPPATGEGSSEDSSRRRTETPPADEEDTEEEEETTPPPAEAEGLQMEDLLETNEEGLYDFPDKARKDEKFKSWLKRIYERARKEEHLSLSAQTMEGWYNQYEDQKELMEKFDKILREKSVAEKIFENLSNDPRKKEYAIQKKIQLFEWQYLQDPDGMKEKIEKIIESHATCEGHKKEIRDLEDRAKKISDAQNEATKLLPDDVVYAVLNGNGAESRQLREVKEFLHDMGHNFKHYAGGSKPNFSAQDTINAFQRYERARTKDTYHRTEKMGLFRRAYGALQHLKGTIPNFNHNDVKAFDNSVALLRKHGLVETTTVNERQAQANMRRMQNLVDQVATGFDSTKSFEENVAALPATYSTEEKEALTDLFKVYGKNRASYSALQAKARGSEAVDEIMGSINEKKAETQAKHDAEMEVMSDEISEDQEAFNNLLENEFVIENMEGISRDVRVKEKIPGALKKIEAKFAEIKEENLSDEATIMYKKLKLEIAQAWTRIYAKAREGSTFDIAPAMRIYKTIFSDENPESKAKKKQYLKAILPKIALLEEKHKTDQFKLLEIKALKRYFEKVQEKLGN